MHISTRVSTIRLRANQDPRLAIVIGEALGWEAVEVGELLAGDFDPLPSEAKLIARAVAEFDLECRVRARRLGLGQQPDGDRRAR